MFRGWWGVLEVVILVENVASILLWVKSTCLVWEGDLILKYFKIVMAVVIKENSWRSF